MTWMLISLAVMWVSTSIAAYLLLEAAWLFVWDLRRSDRRMFIVMSALGPASLVAAVAIYFIEKPRDQRSDGIIKKKTGGPL